MNARHLTGSFILLAMVALLLATGCSDDETCPTCPSPQYQNPDFDELSFANVWPSADQNAWIHDLASRGYEGDPDDAVDPDDPDPELPAMAELHARLAAPVDQQQLGDAEGLYRLRLDGEVTTMSGVTAQQVMEEVYTQESWKQQIPTQPQRLRAAILAARPDLRDGGSWPLADKDIGDELSPPILMGGYAFAATDTGIFSYGDINDQYSWTYLEESLDVGHEFSIQLVPDIADDIFLYGRIWSHGDLAIGDRVFGNCVECFYVIDMGIGIITDEQGTLLAKARSYIYGSVFYAPGVGPVQCHQRMNGLQSTAYDPSAQPFILENRATISGWDASRP